MNMKRGMAASRPVAVGAHCAALTCLSLAPASWAVDLNARYTFDIAPQKLTTALVEVSRQADVQVVSDTKLVSQIDSPGASGQMSLQDALRAVLAGTTLDYKASGSDVIAVGAFGAAAVADRRAQAAVDSTELEEIIVSGTKIDVPIIEAPQSISVISRDQLENRGVQGMTEALRYVPGTIVDNYGYEPRGYEYVILRGFDALYTGNYRDGLNQATGLYFASFITEPYNVEQIEVIRGPSSALFGQSDAGGIVNRMSKRPGAVARSEIEVQAGNMDRKQVAADFGGALNSSQSLRYRLVGVGLDTETQQRYPNSERASNETVFFAPSLSWQISEDTTLTLLTDIRKGDTRGTTFYAEWADGTFSGVPTGEPSYVRYEHDQKSTGYQFEHRFSDTWALRQNFRFARADVEAHDVFGLGLDADGRTFNRFAAATDEQLDQVLLDTQLHATFDAGTTQHSLLVGVDASRVNADVDFFFGPAPSLDLLDPVYRQQIDEPGTLLFSATQENQQLGVYLQDKIELAQRWIVTLGSRYDWVDADTADSGVTVAQIRDEAFTGRAGLIYRMPNGFAPYLSYTESFLPQGGRDFDGNPFKPSRGRQYEVGLKYQPPAGNGLYTIAVFDITKDNILTPDFDHDFFFRTTGERRSRGVELEANVLLAAGLTLSGAYTYLDAEVTKSNDIDLHKRPIQLPEHTASLWADYAFAGPAQGLGLSAGVRYVGERFDDRPNMIESPSFTLFDVAVHYEWSSWRVALNSANLFDKQYFAGTVPSYYPGVERTITASLKYRW